MKNRKPKWCLPKLIILARGQPQEAILETCKANTSGPNEQQWFCTLGLYFDSCYTMCTAGPYS